jgi:hypothetical protein
MKIPMFIRTLATVGLVVAAIFFGQILLDLNSDVTAAPRQGRTSVDGVWGLAPTSFTATGSQTLTPTTSFVLMAQTQTLTLTLATGDAKPGDSLVLSSSVATDTIVNTTGTTLTATKTITTGDVIEFIFLNNKWALKVLTDN